MTAQLLDGKATAAAIRRELAEHVAKLTATDGRPPGLGTVLVGDTPALATRGFTEEDFAEVADVIALALQPEPDIAALRARTEALAAKHSLYPHLAEAEAGTEAGDVR